MSSIIACLEQDPVIAAVGDDKWEKALESPARVIFYMSADLLTIEEKITQAHRKNKYVLVHLDMASGIGKDRTGLRFLKSRGVDGVLSTKAQMIRFARELGLFAVQRFFAVDSGGVEGLGEMFHTTNPDLMEIMPGVVTKVIARYAKSGIPVIAGGLIQTKAEVTDALGAGAVAVSTGQPELWYL